MLVPCLGSLVLLVEGSPIPEDPWGVYDGLMPSESWTDGWTPSSASIWSYVPETTTNPTVDGTCGAAYETVCNGDGDSPCCSLFGWCKFSSSNAARVLGWFILLTFARWIWTRVLWWWMSSWLWEMRNKRRS